MIVDCNLAVRVVLFFYLCAVDQYFQKYPIFGSFADTEFKSDKIRKFSSLARGYLANFIVLESSSVLC